MNTCWRMFLLKHFPAAILAFTFAIKSSVCAYTFRNLPSVGVINSASIHSLEMASVVDAHDSDRVAPHNALQFFRVLGKLKTLKRTGWVNHGTIIYLHFR